MLKKSAKHLESVDESYAEHLLVAFRYGLRCMAAGIMAILHGLVPGCFSSGASNIVKSLYEKGRK